MLPMYMLAPLALFLAVTSAASLPDRLLEWSPLSGADSTTDLTPAVEWPVDDGASPAGRRAAALGPVGGVFDSWSGLDVDMAELKPLASSPRTRLPDTKSGISMDDGDDGDDGTAVNLGRIPLFGDHQQHQTNYQHQGPHFKLSPVQESRGAQRAGRRQTGSRTLTSQTSCTKPPDVRLDKHGSPYGCQTLTDVCVDG